MCRVTSVRRLRSRFGGGLVPVAIRRFFNVLVGIGIRVLLGILPPHRWSEALGGRPHLACFREERKQARRPLAGLTVQWHQLGDHGIQTGAIGIEGAGDAVVAVHHPVLAVELDQINRRKRYQSFVSQEYAAPACLPVAASERLEGKEVTASLRRSGNRGATNLLEWHEAKAELAGTRQTPFPVELIRARQPLLGPPAEPSSDDGIAPRPSLVGR